MNYVSNSSSSSFIVTKDLTLKGINCLKLSEEQKKLIDGYKNYDEQISINPEQDYWLTQFISDCSSLYDNIHDVNHVYYQEGQLNETPRNEDFYNEYQISEFGESVFLLKQHDVAKQMSLSKFVTEYKKTELPRQFLVKYEDDGIKLIYVW